MGDTVRPPPPGGQGGRRQRDRPGGAEGGDAGGPESRRGVARSLSSRCRRHRHQTHSPWGRCRVGSGPGLPESQGVQVGEDMTCLGNEFWNETYISSGVRAGRGWAPRRTAPRRATGSLGPPARAGPGGWSLVGVQAHHVLEGVLEAGSAGGLDRRPELRALLLVLPELHLDDHDLRAFGGLRPWPPSPRPAR